MAKKKNASTAAKTKEATRDTASPSTHDTPSSFGRMVWIVSIVVILVGFLAQKQLSSQNTAVQDEPVVAQTEQRSLEEDKPVETNPLESTNAPNYFSTCEPEDLAQFLHKEPVPGFHILCFSRMDGNKLKMDYFEKGMNSSGFVESSMKFGFPVVRKMIERSLKIEKEPDGMQPWALFSSKGHFLVDADATGNLIEFLVDKVGMALLFEGGQFLWPGVEIGFKRQVELYSVMPVESPSYTSEKTRTVTLETLSLSPLVLSVDEFLSEEECQHIQEKATPTMQYSEVVLMDKDAGRPASDFRTSQTTFVSATDDPMLEDIDYRTASLTRIPRKHQEHSQVLRYGIGEKYLTHHDYFDKNMYANDPSVLRLTRNGYRNRLATVFWYLSDVESGGETVFPRFNGGRERTSADCETGLKVRPKLGKSIIFYSLKADGTGDPASLHGACPVHEGVKWAANKWVWNERMGYIQ